MIKRLSYLGLTALVALSSCSNDSDSKNEPDVKPDQSSAALEITREGEKTISAANKLSFKLLESAVSENAEAAHVCLSPVSVLEILDAIANGSDAVGQQKILSELDLSGVSGLADLNQLCTEFTNKLGKLDSEVTFAESNSLWVTPGYKVNTNYEKFYADMKGVVVDDAPYGVEGMVNINRFVESKTNGMITDFLKYPLDESNTAVLLNAGYFKGNWVAPFEKSHSFSGSFNNADGTKCNVTYMKATGSLRCAESDDYVMVNIPFGSDVYSMSFILPKDSLSNAIPTNEEWEALAKTLSYEEIDLELPKFSVAYSADDMLSHFSGLNNITCPGILAASPAMSINRVLHSAKVSIDEQGCEAAGATLGGSLTIGGTPVQPEPLHFNRPFTFVISEKTTGALIFIGHIKGF